MKANDLMLGNWLYYTEITRFPMYVVDIAKDCVYLDFDDNEGDIFEILEDKDLIPIPLSPEILRDLGFESIETNCNPNPSLEFRMKLSSNKVIFVSLCDSKKNDFCVYNGYKRGFYHPIDMVAIHIKYVHELQNYIHLFAGDKIQLKFNCYGK